MGSARTDVERDFPALMHAQGFGLAGQAQHDKHQIGDC